jgi:hypothetical protein
MDRRYGDHARPLQVAREDAEGSHLPTLVWREAATGVEQQFGTT